MSPYRPLEEIDRLRAEVQILTDTVDGYRLAGADHGRHIGRLRSRLSQIQEEAEAHEDGAPDADPVCKAMSRIVSICTGERVI